ncbi:hypothetical protein [Amycolatopsis sp. VC5-11]|uniref:hypothetical protein n=1 Tax=Amycolatopsis sp. VC5-11 TaxID=3120156 RepID=UPI003009ACE3
MWEDTAFTVAASQDDKASAPDGFVLEPDEARMLLDKLTGVQQKLQAMHQKAAKLCSMTTPSQDPSTVAAHTAMHGDGHGQLGAYSYGGGHIDLQLDHVTELIKRIRQALGITVANDQDQGGLITQAGKSE